MSSIVQILNSKDLISLPDHIIKGIQYETIMGSVSYGVADTTDKTRPSDIDIYGFSIPYLNMVFPHLDGEIYGFGRQIKRFHQYQQHHIKDVSNNKEYDITIFSIPKYFQLLMDNNPNIIDSIFTSQKHVLYCSKVGNLVRENRKLFLHKGSFHKMKGYAFSQLSKIKSKKILDLVKVIREHNISSDTIEEWYHKGTVLSNLKLSCPDINFKTLLKDYPTEESLTKRLPPLVKYGYDLKFAYNLVRLMNEAEQILVEHDLDLERNREQLKSIRRGEWTLRQIEEYFDVKEKYLEGVYAKSDLQHSPDEDAIKRLLINCLELHFGNLNNAVSKPSNINLLINKLQDVIDKAKAGVLI